MKIFLLSTDQTSQFVGGVVSGVVGGGVMLIVIIAMVIITIIVYQKYKPVSFHYRSKTAGIELCKIHCHRYMYMHSIAIKCMQ